MQTFQDLWMRAAAMAFETSHATVVTLSHRMPMLAETSLWPTPEGLFEAQAMVTEKVAAVIEGTMAAMVETGAMTMRAAMGQSDPAALASGMLSIAMAAAEPAGVRVRANARRYTER